MRRGHEEDGMRRRRFLGAAGSVAALSLTGGMNLPAEAQTTAAASNAPHVSGRRKLMAQKPWIVPIPGTTQMAHLLQNIGADAVRFTPSELAELNAGVRAIEVRGARLPEQVLVFSGVEAPAKR